MSEINLMLGDCLERMKEIPDGSVDMILTDPPYGMDFQSNRRVKKEKFKKIENDKSLNWLDGFVDLCYLKMRDNSGLYVFCSWHNVDVFKQAMERRFKVKNLIVWVKNNHGSGDLKGGYAPKHEFVIYACKGRVLNRGKRIPDVIFADKIPSNILVHPTEKNIEMLEGFIKQHTDACSCVLDPFMGSGTTGVAAKNLNRSFIGIELDAGYFEIAKNRINSVDLKDLV
jgi:site-specific DNA-methyltransferase (adenine-specific)